MAQGDVSNAKDDTRFYVVDGGGGVSDLAVDLSHQATDITAAARSVYEQNAQGRWDTSGPAAWELDLTFDGTDTGYLYSYETGGNGVRLVLTSGGTITAYVDNSSIAAVTVPDIDAGGDDVIVSWSMEPNPLTTGASDAYRSELRVWNVDDSSYAQTVAVHAAVTSVDTDAIWLASDTSDSNFFRGTPNRLRFSAGRFHPASEAREDLVANTSAPTLTLASRLEVAVPTRDSGVGAHDFFTGPIYQAVAASLHQVDLRQAGAVRAESFLDDPAQDESFPAVRSTLPPGATTYTMLGQYLVYRPVPLTCNRLKVRVHIQSYRAGAGGSADNVLIRAYSMSRPPVSLAGGDGSGWERTFVSLTVLADHGSGSTGGAWYTFDLLTITRDPSGKGTWVGLAFDVTDAGGAGSTADQRWLVRGWSIEPGLEEVAGGLPLA